MSPEHASRFPITVRDEIFPPSLIAAEQYAAAARGEWNFARERLKAEIEKARIFGVGIYGTARSESGDADYADVINLAYDLARAIDPVFVTGGMGGTMKAAPEGAKSAAHDASDQGLFVHGRVVGICLEDLPDGQAPNELSDIILWHADFSTRLQDFLDRTRVSIFLPGGVGTQTELTYMLQHRQIPNKLPTNHLLIAHSYWQPLFDTMHQMHFERRLANGERPFIRENDTRLMLVTNDTQAMISAVKTNYSGWLSDQQQNSLPTAQI